MIYEKLIEKEGEDKYLLKICEELAELQQALLHFKDDKADITDVYDEIADVLHVQLPKIKYYLWHKTGVNESIIEFNVNTMARKKLANLKKLVGN